MEKTYIKKLIDNELCQVEMSRELKNNIRNATDKTYIFRENLILKKAIACLICFLLCGTTVYAGYYIWNKIQVNGETLPELDSMQVIQTRDIELNPNENGMYMKDYTSYEEVQEDLGVELLNSDLSLNNPYMLGNLMTDGKDFVIIKYKNYIIGDTSNFQYIEEENRYSYDNGEEYYSPISLMVDVILSDNQMENGWDTEYLGYYEYVEQYTSLQGYKVNVLQDTRAKDMEIENYTPEKVAIFVANGIRYTIKGRTSMANIKEIVNSMN